MTNWTETYRGAVPPWQCDVTEHFTIAYYFDRLEEAEANLADDLGLGELPRSSGLIRRIDARFARELREGASFHVESAALNADSGLRLGHRYVDSANGEVVTWFDELWELPTPLIPQRRAAIETRLGAWNGPTTEKRAEVQVTDSFIPTARGRVKPGDVNAAGNFSLGAIVHRFSNASGQLGAAIGADAAYLQQQRRGFSTFELDLALKATAPTVGDHLVVESALIQIGKSSIRLLHRMTNGRSGAEIATLGQYGVHFDMEARRPAPLPEMLRQAAGALLPS